MSEAEQPSKPEWATLTVAVNRMIQEAEDMRDIALGKRCPEWINGGTARCTADAEPAHEHRHDPQELP